MTLRIQIEGVRNIKGQQFINGQLQLNVCGGKADWLVSEVLSNVDQKWKPPFRVDCSHNDQLQFHLFKVQTARNLPKKLVAIQAINQAPNVTVLSMSDQLNIHMRQQHVGYIDMYVLYNPYQFYQGQYCQKIDLNMKVDPGIIHYIEEVSEKDQMNGSMLKDTFPITNRYEYEYDDKNRPKRQIIKYNSFARDSPYHVPAQIHRSHSDHESERLAEYIQQLQKSEARQSVIVEEDEQSYRDRSGRSNLVSGSKGRRSNRIFTQLRGSKMGCDVNFYKGPCRTVNAFSCMDEGMVGQDCSFTEAVLKRRS